MEFEKMTEMSLFKNKNRHTDKERKGGINQEVGINIYTLLCVKLEKGMATHSSVLPWRIPWQGSLAGCGPQGRKEWDKSWATDETTAMCEIGNLQGPAV